MELCAFSIFLLTIGCFHTSHSVDVQRLYGIPILLDPGLNPDRVAKPIEAVLRPRGLGLGAESKLSKPPPLVAKEEGDLVLRRGAYVRIEQGQYKDMYGQVLCIAPVARVIDRNHPRKIV